jgi:hypothetical protein
MQVNYKICKRNNKELTYAYKEDVISVLSWVLGHEEFDGIGREK